MTIQGRAILGPVVVALLASGAARAQDSFGGSKPAPPQPSVAAPSAQPERQGSAVTPTRELHTGPMHGPTPSSIPGGQVITTQGLQALVSGGKEFLLLDVLGGPQIIPRAQSAVAAAQAGSFVDVIQQQFGLFLQHATKGNKEMPLVLYCLSTECWMSYNAALRAINLGYRNVHWYRGGIEAWQAAGQPVQQAGMGAPQR